MLMKFIKTTIIGGLLFLVPVVLLIVIFEKALNIAKHVVGPLVTHFPDKPVLGVAIATLIAAALLLVVSFIAGLIGQTKAGQDFVGWIEKVLLSKMPGYLVVRGIVSDMTHIDELQDNPNRKSVLVRIEDAWQIGVVVDELSTGELAVFVPGAPSPLSGSLYYLTPERVRPSGLTFGEATNILRRIGNGSAEHLKIGP
ncbi:DUF502 domain-containing protein [Uliginosibacterium sp. H3]|uniref:DUF502 domain-containing protein n=1 Tax=Uliginosibacterium silvisoli TaxID=3114758 RepID=A0ABU6K4M7_9RHOO|nr:DUF502 domain-containing protein [Uliginosibacterium sp. H3]